MRLDKTMLNAPLFKQTRYLYDTSKVLLHKVGESFSGQNSMQARTKGLSKHKRGPL